MLLCTGKFLRLPTAPSRWSDPGSSGSTSRSASYTTCARSSCSSPTSSRPDPGCRTSPATASCEWTGNQGAATCSQWTSSETDAFLCCHWKHEKCFGQAVCFLLVVILVGGGGALNHQEPPPPCTATGTHCIKQVLRSRLMH